MLTRQAWSLVVIAWLAMAAAGIASVQWKANQPGHAGTAPSRLSPLQAPAGPARVIVFAHPLCPCTRATLHELRAVVAQAPASLEVSVMFYTPSQPPADWSRGNLWDLVAAIPRVKVAEDIDGKMAGEFGAKTSGWTLLYDASGALQFAGGITAARGHEGDNAGRQLLLQRIRDIETMTTGVGSAAVFGCSLLKECGVEAEQGSRP